MSYHIYCLNFGDKRKAAIQASFNNAGLEDKVTYHPGILISDVEALVGTKVKTPIYYFNSAVTMGHIAMMKMFLQTDHQYGIFCENDIKLHKDIKTKIPYYIDKMQKLHLEILLLGYLVNTLALIGRCLLPTVFAYENYLWGAQMYILTREKCIDLVNKYDTDYIIKAAHDSKFVVNPDALLTKDGRRALVYPMLAVECVDDAWISPRHLADAMFHRKCMKYNLTADFV
jgi:hypothetical protein